MPDFKTYVRQNLPPLNVSGAREAEIVEELVVEFEERYERAIRNGLSPDEAWRHVTTHARSWNELAEDLRLEVREHVPVETEPRPANVLTRLLMDLRQDFRIARRQLYKSPAFAVIAVLTLAFGIGANTAIFTLMNAVILRPLPVREPQQLVLFGNGRGEGSTPYLANGRLFSYPFYREFLERSQTFSDVAAVRSVLIGTHGRIGSGTEMEKIDVELVSGNYFKTLGLNPVAGRLLGVEDDRIAGGHPVAVASRSWWQRRFAKIASVVGSTVKINSTVYTIVGVAPFDFNGVTVGRSPDFWIPLTMQKEISPAAKALDNKRFQTLHLIARLKAGANLERVADETTAIYRRIALDHAQFDGDPREFDAIQRRQIELMPAARGRSNLRAEFSSPLTALMVVVALVLLIACANIANILLARAVGRQSEIAVRMSLGAARSRLVRQLFVESGLLAVGGAVLGLIFAWGAGRLLLIMVSKGSEPVALQIAPDVTVLLFTIALAVLAVFLFGTGPALFATRLGLSTALKEGRATTASAKRNRLARGLAVAQVALSLVLLVGAGLFLRSFINLMEVDTGFDKENVLVMQMDAAAAGYLSDTRLETVMQRIEERVGSMPGIQGAGFAMYLFDGGSWSQSVLVPGRDEDEEDENVVFNVVGPQFFDAVNLPIVLGRSLTVRDNLASRKVAVINETMARMYFTGVSPLGRTFAIEDQPDFQDMEVVGVVKDAKYETLDERPTPAAFFPHAQHQGDRELSTFVVRHTVDAAQVVADVRSAIREIDANLPVGEVTTLSRLVDESALQKRVVAQLSTFFGMLALFLACLGIYGVMSCGIARRTNEFGIRMALGADRRQVLWVVLSETLRMVGLGAGIGLFLALASSWLVESLLFGMNSNDPLTLALALLAILTIALFAGYLPARRATRIDPLIALRHE